MCVLVCLPVYVLGVLHIPYPLHTGKTFWFEHSGTSRSVSGPDPRPSEVKIQTKNRVTPGSVQGKGKRKIQRVIVIIHKLLC